MVIYDAILFMAQSHKHQINTNTVLPHLALILPCLREESMLTKPFCPAKPAVAQCRLKGPLFSGQTLKAPSGRASSVKVAASHGFRHSHGWLGRTAAISF